MLSHVLYLIADNFPLKIMVSKSRKLSIIRCNKKHWNYFYPFTILNPLLGTTTLIVHIKILLKCDVSICFVFLTDLKYICKLLFTSIYSCVSVRQITQLNYNNNKIKFVKKSRNLYVIFNCCWWATHCRIDYLSIWHPPTQYYLRFVSHFD